MHTYTHTHTHTHTHTKSFFKNWIIELGETKFVFQEKFHPNS